MIKVKDIAAIFNKMDQEKSVRFDVGRTHWAVENDCGIVFIEDIENVPRQAFYDRGKVKVTNLNTRIQHTLECDDIICADTLNVWIKSTKTVSKSVIYRYKKYMKQGGLYTL